MQAAGEARGGAAAFALIYFTFFLDNVLLTVLVPIIPDWVRGEALALWTTQDAPLASLLNHTAQRAVAAAGTRPRYAFLVPTLLHTTTVRYSLANPMHLPGQACSVCDETEGAGGAGGAGGASQAVVGVVLGAKAAAQLLAAPLAGAAVCRRGAAPVLGRGGWRAALCVAAGRAAHGAGAALGAVSGLALAARVLAPPQRDRAIGALLGAVALGVLVGYPFGGATYALWSRGAPFLLIAAALLADLALQYMFLDKEEYNRPCDEGAGGVSWRGVWALAGREGAGACAGAVLLTTCVMAALEPCLPLWLMHKFHPQRWLTGAVFVPDSAAYLLAASLLGGAARRLGAERVALAGQLAVALAALAVPHARSVSGLAAPHVALGAGLGAADAALVPALLARHPRREAHVAALLQAASSAAYALGPVLGGAVSWCVGFETAMRALGVLNLLYVAYLYRALTAHPLSRQVLCRAVCVCVCVYCTVVTCLCMQWGASSPEEEGADYEVGAERLPLAPRQ
ncbi:chromaffin granule amine transporter-like [Spodoptera litura]|uniref:Chromaffin granule amine transporter-like n=1 Tax=Spodoptera litura TaxID=69820 RepID=A0A9J7J476_SPOLT|nr:chromaffin granule amine transporter-like [Spodoptera litura]